MSFKKTDFVISKVVELLMYYFNVNQAPPIVVEKANKVARSSLENPSNVVLETSGDIAAKEAEPSVAEAANPHIKVAIEVIDNNPNKTVMFSSVLCALSLKIAPSRVPISVAATGITCPAYALSHSYY